MRRLIYILALLCATSARAGDFPMAGEPVHRRAPTPVPTFTAVNTSTVTPTVTPTPSSTPTPTISGVDYITGSAQSTLSAEQSLGALTTGLLLNTSAASTGVLSQYPGTVCTNQFTRGLSVSGVATCATVSLTADVTGTLPVANGGSGAVTLTGLLLGNGTSAFTGVTTSAGVASAISDETGTGVLTLATAPTFTTSITTPKVIGSNSLLMYPGANATTAVQIDKADGTTNIVTVDTINARVGVGTASPGALLDISSATGGSGTGLRLIQAANNASGGPSYVPIDFTVPTTGLIGQFLVTASNYVNGGLNLATNSLAVIAEASGGQLYLASAGANGFVTINTGGYNTANTRVTVTSAGLVGIGDTVPLATLTVGGHIHTSGTAPTLANCGTTPSIVGNDGVMRITLGTVALVGACTVTFNANWTNVPICTCNNETTATAAARCAVTSPLVGSIVLTPVTAFVLSDKIGVICQGYE